MILAKNYQKFSKYVKVMAKIRWVYFWVTVYSYVKLV